MQRRCLGRERGGFCRVVGRALVRACVRLKRWTANRTLHPAMLLLLLLAACVARLLNYLKRLLQRKPRFIWGPVPIINIKFLSQACNLLGYRSRTVVYNVYPAFRRKDFDVVLDDAVIRARVLRLLLPYGVFLWALFKAEIFCFFFDGGFLRETRLKYLECPLLRLAGKKTIFMPYGSDMTIVSELDPLDRDAMLRDYPQAAQRDAEVRKQVNHFARWADFVVGAGNQIRGIQPRQDIVVFSYLAIDTNDWRPTGDYSDADGHVREVVIVHTPNHRALKGTPFLVKAVEDLLTEGLKIRLQIIERRTNLEVKAALQAADILAEQFLGGYALSGVEGMAMGKPILCNLSRHAAELKEKTSLQECPAVSTTPETLREDLRTLVENPLLRETRGRAGRDYVEKYHSLKAIGELLDRICRVIWYGEPIDVQAWYHQR